MFSAFHTGSIQMQFLSKLCMGTIYEWRVCSVNKKIIPLHALLTNLWVFELILRVLEHVAEGVAGWPGRSPYLLDVCPALSIILVPLTSCTPVNSAAFQALILSSGSCHVAKVD